MPNALHLPDSDATRAHGRDTAALLRTGGAVIALTGDLGTGKTTWTQGLAEGLGLRDPVRSPTYTYRFDYVLPDGRQLVHADLYRLPEDADLTGFGIDELMERDDTVLVIEWAERLPFALPPHAWKLSIAHAPDGGRTMTIDRP